MMRGKTRNFLSRLEIRFNYYRALFFGRRTIAWLSNVPFISFTFDDFPRSAYLLGGKILKKYGIRASYYTSLGLMGKNSPSGQLFMLRDLEEIIAEGHEIGSHTYDHLDAWATESTLFEETVLRNQKKMEEIFPGFVFKTLAYPRAEPHPRVKKATGKQFMCCRGGGQDLNMGKIDLNSLRSCFIHVGNRNDSKYFQKLIQKNAIKKGWLIFSTHDISEHPSVYGCLPTQLEEIIKYAISSGAIILPVCDVYSRVIK